MKRSAAEEILHPVRLRILLALTARPMTAGELAERLPEVPQATLYRGLKRLADAGFLQVVEERPVRGAMERLFAVAEGAASLGAEEVEGSSPEAHMRYFTAFVASLMADFWRFLSQERFDFQADGVGYRQVPLYLSDAELMELVTQMNALIAPLLGNAPAPGRRRRLLSSILMPDVDPPMDEA